MSPREVIETLLRRWPIWSAVLLLTAAAGWFVAHPTPTYIASEIVAVEPPSTDILPNQLTDLRPSLAITSAVVAQRLKNTTAEAQLRRTGVVGDYDLVPRNSGTTQNPAYLIPSIQITVTAHDAEAAARSVALVLTAFTNELVSLQDEWAVAGAQRLSIEVLAPTGIQAVVRAKSRALAGAGLVGLGVALTTTLWSDRVLRRRNPNRAPRRLRIRWRPHWMDPRDEGNVRSDGAF